MAWTGDWPDPVAATEQLVRRHLGAFGPATVADIARWAGVPVASVRPGTDAVEAAGDLRRYRSETGSVLVDLVDARCPTRTSAAAPTAADVG
jgi:hypothetical protein